MAITCLAVSANAKVPWVAIGGADGDVRLCRANVEHAEPTPVTRSWGNNSIVDLAFSDDGRRLAIATGDRSVHVVNVDGTKRNPESSVRMEDQDQITTSIVLAGDGRLVFGAGPIGVGRTDWFRPPPPPNRAGGFPAHGSPVSGLV